MAYTTPDEVRAILSFVGPSDRGSPSGVSDEQLIAAIEDARVEVDVSLSVRYPVPFDDPRHPEQVPVPAMVKRLNRDIAAHLATLTFLRGATAAQPMPRWRCATRRLSGSWQLSPRGR